MHRPRADGEGRVRAMPQGGIWGKEAPVPPTGQQRRAMLLGDERRPQPRQLRALARARALFLLPEVLPQALPRPRQESARQGPGGGEEGEEKAPERAEERGDDSKERGKRRDEERKGEFKISQ